MENKKGKKINIGLLLFRLISIIIIIICLILLYRWNDENNTNSSLAEELSDSFVTDIPNSPDDTEVQEETNTSSNYESIDVNFDELLKQNDQTVGWIKVSNTNINFPIVQSNDNSFYLKHNFSKKYNSAGWIFADCTNNFDTLDKNTIIYGHNRQNGTMFSNLKYLLKTNWFEDSTNKSFIFNTPNNKYIAQIFSVYKINKNKLTVSNSFDSEESFNQFISDCKQTSIYDFGLDVSYRDNVITLCTCDNNTQYRIVVHAKLINAD